jgi:dolichol-phosphate mannosyltransferase
VNKEKKILVFTATYNEKESIEKLILGIKENLPLSSIFIIDDNSPDGTAAIIKELQIKVENLDLLVRDKKSGLDSAHKLAFEYAKKNNFDYLITMDADFSHDPKELTKIVENLHSNSFVLGSRYVYGGKCLMKGSRLIISYLGNKFIKIISGIKSNEFTTSYRGFNLEKLENFHLNNVNYKGYSFFMGTIFELYKIDIDIKEIPIIFQDRSKGISKIPRFELFRTLKNLLIFSFKK